MWKISLCGLLFLGVVSGCGQPPQEGTRPQNKTQPTDIDKLKLWGVKAGWREPVRRYSAVGFYPQTTDLILKQVKKFLKAANPNPPEGEILGLISPHAGYIYCWQTAAYGYKLLLGKKFDTVLILATSHNSPKTSVCDVAFYNMPWGSVPVDRDVVKALIKSGKFQYIPTAHQTEHAVETQLPFLCAVLKDFKIVPIVVSLDADGKEKDLADALQEATKNKKVLVVVSTDLTHYPDHKTAQEVEKKFLDVLKRLDVKEIKESSRRLIETHKNVNCVACGLEALCVAIEFLKMRGADKFVLLHHSDSYINIASLPEKERTGIKPDPEKVVGYASGVFLGE